MKKKSYLTVQLVPSPDVSERIPLETRHHNGVFAVILAHEIGYFDPLIARLRDPDVKLDPVERKFLADKLDSGGKLLPRGGLRKLQMYRRQLRIAAHYLQFARGEPGRGRKAAAEKFAADQFGILDTSEVRRAVRFAKTVNYDQWRWWDIALRMAHKNKIEQLHRTY